MSPRCRTTYYFMFAFILKRARKLQVQAKRLRADFEVAKCCFIDINIYILGLSQSFVSPSLSVLLQTKQSIYSNIVLSHLSSHFLLFAFLRLI